jgi:L-seryl-tRNA(Ser) seleniumtransferase
VIARLTGAESGWVTSGAAAGLSLATAACVAGTDTSRMHALPSSPAPEPELIMLRGHRNAYDHALRVGGARIVDVGYPYSAGTGLTYGWQLDGAITPATVAVAYLAKASAPDLPLRQICEIAHARGISVIVDAAAELPPAGNLRRFVEEGADAVVFSGGKAVRGPQASGVLAGRKDIVDSVRLQTLDMDVDRVEWRRTYGAEPPQHGLGRGFKVGKEEIVGLVAALEEFVERDHEAERDELGTWLEDLAGAVQRHRAAVDRDASFYPRLRIEVGGEDEARARVAELAALDPPILVPHDSLHRGAVVICPEAVDPRDRDRVRSALAAL